MRDPMQERTMHGKDGAAPACSPTWTDYTDLLDSLNAIVWEGDPHTFQFTFVSRAAERLLGYPVDQWLKEPTFWCDHIHPDDRDWAVSFCANATMEGRDHVFEYRMLAADGRVVWLRDVVSVVTENGRPVKLRGIMVDITEKKLAQERFTRAFRNAPTATIITTFEEGRIVEVNDRFERLSEFTRDELIGRTVIELGLWVNLDDRARLLAQVSQHGLVRNFETLLRTKSGKVCVVSASVTTIELEGKPCLLANLLDITERKQMEQALRESEEAFRMLFEANPLGIGLYRPDGTFLRCNAALQKLLGYSAEELKTVDPTHPDDRAEGAQLFREVAEGRRDGYCRQKRYIRKDGRVIWANLTAAAVHDAKGDVRYIVLIAEDVTDRKHAEEALQKRLRQQAAVAELGQWALATTDLDALLQKASELAAQVLDAEFCEVMELTPDGTTLRLRAGVGWREGTVGTVTVPVGTGSPAGYTALLREPVIVADMNQEKRFHVPPLLRAHGVVSGVTVPIHAKEQLLGVLGVYSARRQPFTRDDIYCLQAIAHVLGAAIYRLRIEDALRRARDELEERVRERTAALERTNLRLREINAELASFARTVAHDLRAPLRAMQGFAAALMEDYADRLDSVGREYAQRIVAAAQRMDRLIQDLLTYSQLSRAEILLQPVPLDTVVDEVIQQLRETLRERNAQVQVDHPLPTVLGHPTTLLQVLANLVHNAVKFVADGVTPQVRVRAEEHGNWVRVWVEDNGIGIAPEHQERIFGVFERLHSADAYPGTGIGLAIVRKGVERMGGRVGVVSQVNKGSRFWFELRKA